MPNYNVELTGAMVVVVTNAENEEEAAEIAAEEAFGSNFEVIETRVEEITSDSNLATAVSIADEVVNL